jgi:hypothetical protein
VEVRFTVIMGCFVSAIGNGKKYAAGCAHVVQVIGCRSDC